MATDVETAWAAGLFEGEGCFAYQGEGKKNSVRAELAMTDFETVRRFHEVVRVGYVRIKSKRDENHNDQLLWRVTDRGGVLDVLTILSPWLSERRRSRGQEVLDLQAAKWRSGANGRYQLAETMRAIDGE